MIKTVTAKFIFFDDGNRLPVKRNRPILEAQYKECANNVLFYQRMIAEMNVIKEQTRKELEKIHVITEEECYAYFKKHGRDATYLDMCFSRPSSEMDYLKKASEISGMTHLIQEMRNKLERNYQLAKTIEGEGFVKSITKGSIFCSLFCLAKL